MNIEKQGGILKRNKRSSGKRVSWEHIKSIKKILNLFLIHMNKIQKNLQNLLKMLFKKNSINEVTPKANKQVKQEPQSESLNFGLWSRDRSKNKKVQVNESIQESFILKDIDKDINIYDKDQQHQQRKTDSSMDKYKRKSNYAKEPQGIQLSEKKQNNSKVIKKFEESKIQRQDNLETPSFQSQNQLNIKNQDQQIIQEPKQIKKSLKNIQEKMKQFRKSIQPLNDINLDIADPESQLQPLVLQSRQKKHTSREDRIINLLRPSSQKQNQRQNQQIKNPVLPQNIIIYGEDESQNSENLQKNLKNPLTEQRQNKIIDLINKNQNISIFDQKEIGEDDNLLADFHDSSDRILLKEIPEYKDQKNIKKINDIQLDKDISELNNEQQNREEAKVKISIMANDHINQSKNKQKNDQYIQQDIRQSFQNINLNSTPQTSKSKSIIEVQNFKSKERIKKELNFLQSQEKINSDNKKIKQELDQDLMNNQKQEIQQDQQKKEYDQQLQYDRQTITKNINFQYDQNTSIQKNQESINIFDQYESRDTHSIIEHDPMQLNLRKELTNLTQEISKIITTHNFSLIGDKAEKKLQRRSLKFRELKKIILRKYLLREKVKRKQEFYNKIQATLDHKLTYLKSVIPTKQKSMQFRIFQKSDQEKIIKKFFNLKLLKVRILPRSREEEYTFIYRQKLMIFLKKKIEKQVIKDADTNLLQKFDFFEYTENTIEEDKRKFEEILGKYFNQRTQKNQYQQTIENVLNEICNIYSQLEEVVEKLTEFLRQQKIKNLNFNRNSQFEFEAQPRRVPFLYFKFILQTNNNFQWNLNYQVENKEVQLSENIKDILRQNQEQLDEYMNKIFEADEISISKKLTMFINRLHQKFSFSREEDDLFEESSYLLDLKFSNEIDRFTNTQLF